MPVYQYHANATILSHASMATPFAAKRFYKITTEFLLSSFTITFTRHYQSADLLFCEDASTHGHMK